MDIQFEPHLVEAVVRRLIDAGHSASIEAYRRLFDALVATGMEKDPHRLASLHRYVFLSLGFEAIFAALDAEAPLGRPIRVSTPDEYEGCFLPESRNAVIVRVRPERFDHTDRLSPYLRHEWAHVVDMLDPGFGYPDAPPPLDPPSRDRYALLWGVHVDARSERAGRAPWRPREQWRAGVSRLWASAPPDVRNRAFDAFWAAERIPHAQIVEVARDPRMLLASYAGVASRGYPGGRCPICGFATFEWTFPGTRLTPDLVRRMGEDFPAWTPEDGACGRCIEIYEIRAGIW